MKYNSLNLKGKILYIPLGIIFITFLSMGLVFSKLIVSNSKTTQKTEMYTLINNSVIQVQTGLSLITGTQLPGDAFVGIEAEDYELADDLFKQLESLGVSKMQITDLEGNILHPKEQGNYESLTAVLKHASQKRNDIEITLMGQDLIGFAPIIDVETPMGFMVFNVNIPAGLESIAEVVCTAPPGTKGKTKPISECIAEAHANAKIVAESFLSKMLLIIAITLVLSLLMIALLLGKTSKNIIGPVKQLLEAFKQQANGDLTQEVHVSTDDEIAQLTLTFNETNHKLNNMLHNVVSRSQSVAVSSSELSESSESISDNAQIQSQETSQAALSMEQLNSSFHGVTQNTADAAGSAKEASELAQTGGSVVTKTINGMNKIAESVRESANTVEALGKRSEQIDNIVQVINDIASQTNLLALNAAIEAARAGEQGRGFAVVADEVRKLAERTTSATNEIGEMIKGIQEDTAKAVESMQAEKEEVEEGVSSANEAGEALNQIVTSVQNVTDMIQQIATAAEEQSTTGETIANTLEHVAEITGKTATEVQNSSQSSHKLDELAQELQHLVGEFKLRTKTGIRSGNQKASVENIRVSSDSSI